MTQTRRSWEPAVREELRQRLLEARTVLLRTVATTDEELATLEARQPGAPIGVRGVRGAAAPAGGA